MNQILINFLFLLLALGIIFLLVGTLAYGGILAAPWVPLRKKDVKRALALARLKPGEALYDLGSGDGRIIIAAGKDFGAKAIGYEVAFLPYLYSYVKILIMGLYGRVGVKYKNFFKEDLSGADVVISFLLPRAMVALKEKYIRELKPGTRIVSCVWLIPGWIPELIDKPSKNDVKIYLYILKDYSVQR